MSLNESPSEKEGKCHNHNAEEIHDLSLNESPSEKEGKCREVINADLTLTRLNESPSEKEGKWLRGFPPLNLTYASMKVPPKRKGNACAT